jgi:metal-responsive CopG/Arc/MetJ family transcriptional regulator
MLEAELLAKQLGVSRSELYTKALKAYLRKYNHDRILHQGICLKISYQI